MTTAGANEQRVAAVPPTENKRTYQLTSGFLRQEMADRANSSSLKIDYAERLMWYIYA